MARPDARPLDAQEALAAIAALRPVLLALARLQLRNDAWAEDCVSETIIAAVEGHARFAGRAALKTWVVGILKHKIIDQFRRAGREISLEAHAELDEGDALDALFGADGHRRSAPQDWADPEQACAQTQFLDLLQACIDRLPAALARVFLMREWMEFETREICKEMGITSTNCFVMLYRARMRLRECLEAGWAAPHAP